MSAGFLDRLRQGLTRTRQVLQMPVGDLVRGRRPLEPADIEAMEEALIAADMGMPAVADAMRVLRERSGEISGGGVEASRSRARWCCTSGCETTVTAAMGRSSASPHQGTGTRFATPKS